MAFNIGINVLEVEGKSAPAIAGAPTSVAGFIVRTRRGPTDKAVRVSNFQQFTRLFGGYHPEYMGAYCINGFFSNGGREAYIARVGGRNGATAYTTLKDSNGDNSFKVKAGYRGKPNSGDWGNDIYLEFKRNAKFHTQLVKHLDGNQPATLKGDPLNEPIDLSPLPNGENRTLSIEIKNVGDITPLVALVDFSKLPDPAHASLHNIVDAINANAGSNITAMVEEANGKKLVLRSKSKGNSASTKIISDGFQQHTLKCLGIENKWLAKSGDKAGQKSASLEGAKASSDVSVALDDDPVGQKSGVNLVYGTGASSKPCELQLRIDNYPKTVKVTFEQDDNRLPDPRKATIEQIKNVIEHQTTLPGEGESLIIATSNLVGGITLRTRSEKDYSRIEVVTNNITPNLLGFPADALAGQKRREASGTSPDPTHNYLQVEHLSGLQEDDWICLSDPMTEEWCEIARLETKTNPGNGQKQYFIHLKNSVNNQYLSHETAIHTGEFDLSISFPPKLKTSPQNVEFWEGLTLTPERSNYIGNQINDEVRGSIYICVDSDSLKSLKGNKIPPDGLSIRLGKPLTNSNQPDPTQNWIREPGKDGDAPEFDHYQSALQLFNTHSIQLLATPDITKDQFLESMIPRLVDYCENDKGDCMFVGHTPFDLEAEKAREFGAPLRRTKAYGAIYWPWIQIADPIGFGTIPTKWIPPDGHVMGVYARTDKTRGVWKAPAGNEAVIRGALAIERDITDVDHTALVKQGSVNGIRNIKGTGIVIDSSRTLSTDSRWLYVNVRLLFNYVKTSLREGLRWVKQEPNRENLWNKIKYNTVTPFLQRLYQAGAFGPGAPEDVFTVVCGPENNPSEQIQLGNLKVEIYFYPARPAETIIIAVGQQDGGSSASEQ